MLMILQVKPGLFLWEMPEVMFHHTDLLTVEMKAGV